MDQRRAENVGGTGDTSNMRSTTALTPEQMRALDRLAETLRAEREAAQRAGYHMVRPTPLNPLGVEKR